MKKCLPRTRNIPFASSDIAPKRVSARDLPGLGPDWKDNTESQITSGSGWFLLGSFPNNIGENIKKNEGA